MPHAVITVGIVLLVAIGLVVAGLAVWRWSDKRAENVIMDALIASALTNLPLFDHAMIADLPEPARRFLTFAIAPGTPLYRVVDLQMEGRLSNGTAHQPNWMAMQARQVLALPEGFVWQVAARRGPVRLVGSDAAHSDGSWTRFWLAGLAPVVRAGLNDDHARSSFGRYGSEAIFWLPTTLMPGPGVHWEELGPDSARVTLEAHGFEQAFDIHLNEEGAPAHVVFQRWSDANPDKRFQLQPFGGEPSVFQTFDGVTIPTRVDGGNFFGTPDYFPFYQVRITAVRFH
ncbi:MAG: DUF6544 family protein [Cohaesibacteraceae bacterium]